MSDEEKNLESEHRDRSRGSEEESGELLQAFITGFEEEDTAAEERDAKFGELVQATAQAFQLNTLHLKDIEETIDHLQGINETDMQVLRETLEAMDVQIIAMRRALEAVRGALLVDRQRAAPGLPDVFPI